MTEYGRNKMEEAKNNGQWNAPKALEITEKHILEVLNLSLIHIFKARER